MGRGVNGDGPGARYQGRGVRCEGGIMGWKEQLGDRLGADGMKREGKIFLTYVNTD